MHRLPSHTVYLLLSERGEVYAGYTSRCIKARLCEHNADDNTGWTAGRGPWHLLALRMFLDRHSALLLERSLKRSKYNKRNWLARVGRLDTLRERHDIPEQAKR